MKAFRVAIGVGLALVSLLSTGDTTYAQQGLINSNTFTATKGAQQLTVITRQGCEVTEEKFPHLFYFHVLKMPSTGTYRVLARWSGRAICRRTKFDGSSGHGCRLEIVGNEGKLMYPRADQGFGQKIEIEAEVVTTKSELVTFERVSGQVQAGALYSVSVQGGQGVSASLPARPINLTICDSILTIELWKVS